MSNLALKIKKTIDLIDLMIDHYQGEIGEIRPQCEALVRSLEEVFKGMSMDDELKKKLKEDIEYLEKEKVLKITKIQGKINTEIEELNEDRQALIESMERDIEGSLEGLDSLLANKEAIKSKIEELSPTTEINPVLKREEIANLKVEDLRELFGKGKLVEEAINTLEVKDLNIKFIDKEFWFPAGKLNLENKNAEDAIRAINILAVLVGVSLYSNIIVAGVGGTALFLNYKNRKQLKPLKYYKDFIYTIYEYEEEIRTSVDNYYKALYKKRLNIIDLKINELKSKLKTSIRKIEQEYDSLLENTRESFRVRREEKMKEIEIGMGEELNKLKYLISEVLKESGSILGEFMKESMIYKRELEKEFNRLNSFELDIVNDELTLNLKDIHLGVEVEDTEVNYVRELPFGSYLFIYKNNKQSMRTLMKYITCQIASRIKGNLIKFNILDPIDYGEGLSDIVNGRNIDSYFNQIEVNEHIKSMLERFTTDIKNIFIGYDSIMDYNKEKVSKGSTPYPYTLNLIQNFNIFDDMDNFKQLLLTRKSGIINLVLISENMVNEAQKSTEGSEVKLDEYLRLVDSFDTLFGEVDGGSIIEVQNDVFVESVEQEEEKSRIDVIKNNLESEINSLLDQLSYLNTKYNLELVTFNEFSEENKPRLNKEGRERFKPISIESDDFRYLGKQITENQKRAETQIFYFKDFVNRIIPKGKEMSEEPIKGLNLFAGYQDGDVEKIPALPLDGETIHYFMGGSSGKGKSNALNAMVNVAIRMYSPEDLHIYLLDFKVIEGRKYMVDPTPHFKCISVTQDAYYLESLFNYLIGELNYRQNKLLPKYNAGKVQDMREKGIKIPEIVVIIDEFTEALKSSEEIQKKILQDSETIARLGRASGVHLFYTSQDVSEKLGEGTLGQFGGRLSLPVLTKSTSKTIIMNDAAADGDYQAVGNLLFNNMGGDEKYNVRLKVPIIQPEDMNANFKLINELCEGKYELNCVMFDSDEVREYNELLEILRGNEEYLKQSKTRHLILGDNAQFDVEDYPVGIEIENGEGNNFYILSQSKKRRIELVNTIVANFAMVGGSNTDLVMLNSNRDYTSFNIADIYKDKFRNVTTVETIEEVAERISRSALYTLEKSIEQEGWEFDKGPVYGVFEHITDMVTKWEEVKSSADLDVPPSKAQITEIIEAVRPNVSETLIVVEGAETVEGLGIGVYGREEEVELVKYAPYYGVYLVCSASFETVGFRNQYDVCFKHRLFGILSRDDYATNQFMKETPKPYGGYQNKILPSDAFKFKRFYIDKLEDDVSKDNRIILPRK